MQSTQPTKLPYVAFFLIFSALFLAYGVIFADELLLALIVYIIVSILPFMVHLNRGGIRPFEPDVFITTILFLYTAPVPLDVLFWGNTTYQNHSDVTSVLVLSTLLLVSFLMSYYVFRLPIGNKWQSQEAAFELFVPKWISLLMIAFGGGLFLLYLYIYFDGILSYLFANSRIDRYGLLRQVSGTGVLSGGIYILHAGWYLLFAQELGDAARSDNPKQRRWVLFRHGLGFLLYVAFFLLAGDRRYPASLALGLAYIFSLHFRFSTSSLIFVLPAGLFLQVFGRIRHLSSQPVEMVHYLLSNFDLSWLNFGQGELGAQFKIAIRLLQEVHANGARLGQTYIDGFLISVPSVIWSERPTSASVWYVERFFPQIYQSGGGLAFSLLGESILNFEVFGPLLIGILLGIVMAVWYKATYARKHSLIGIMAYASSLAVLLPLARSDFASIVKFSLIAVVIPVIMVALLPRFRNPVIQRRSPNLS